MKVYTKTGDKGTTGLLTGERVAKDSLQVEAYGSVDEINSALGMARAQCVKAEVKETVLQLQKLLMLVMAELASNGCESQYVTEEHVTTLEGWIDSYDAKLPPLKAFIIPGDSVGGAALDLARTVTRRAERQCLRFARGQEVAQTEPLKRTVLIVLNRLSDLCFVLSRFENHADS
ncbi:MAG TPA: cob(I)yrinic acid a,c-diamide adenosyltransferase [Patescibacteria group bacterium]|nr:cob(I)yrinic acid a,c-diamide adenosyltransferase [Patescibacteria group bacterium]